MAKAPAGTIPESPVTSELTERRYVYNGDSAPSQPQLSGQPANFAPRDNRLVKKRRRSPFNIIAILVAISMLIIFYVWNKITVNRLVVEVNDLQAQYEKTISTNELLKAEINRKSSLERIGKLAGQMGLTPPREQPVWFSVDEDALERADRFQQEGMLQ